MGTKSQHLGNCKLIDPRQWDSATERGKLFHSDSDSDVDDDKREEDSDSSDVDDNRRGRGARLEMKGKERKSIFPEGGLREEGCTGKKKGVAGSVPYI